MAKLNERLRGLIFPAMDEDLCLGPSDLAAIVDTVDAMVREVHSGYAPLRFNGPTLLCEASLYAGGGNPHPREIRAGTINGSSITLTPFPKFASEVGNISAGVGEFKIVMIGLLAHELSHVRQATGGHRTIDMLRMADAASQTACRTKAYEDYIAYLSTRPEIAAHATQLAAEIMHTKRETLRRAEFHLACRNSPLWTHMTDHPDNRPTSKAAGQAAFRPVSGRLLRNAWWAYLQMSDRQLAWPVRTARWLFRGQQ